jgi:hypothetical protein
MRVFIILLFVCISLSSNKLFSQFEFKKVKFHKIHDEKRFKNLLATSKIENKYSLIAFIYSTRDVYLEKMVEGLDKRFESDSISSFVNANFNCAIIEYQPFSLEWQQKNPYINSFVKNCKVRGAPNIVYVNAIGNVVHKGFLYYYKDSLYMAELKQAWTLIINVILC